ncbi:MAG: MBL fold metallo-hydrolase [Defluviitaleaceae bacterium]|nr:MBL fold metallo-hydrolase [Defluviitaleaceae bacterium]
MSDEGLTHYNNEGSEAPRGVVLTALPSKQPHAPALGCPCGASKGGGETNCKGREKMFDIALVGSGGMMPLHNRFLSSALLRFEGRMLLIDCGEGAQVSIKQIGWGFKTIDCICLTHFHADHVTGLPGLLLSIGHSGREEPLTIIGPIGVAHIVKSLCVVVGELPFDIEFVEIPKEGLACFLVSLL